VLKNSFTSSFRRSPDSGESEQLYAVSLLTIVVSYIALARLAAHGALPEQQMWASSFVQFQFFAVGALIALGLHRKEFKLGLYLRIPLFLGGLILWDVAVHSCGVNNSQLVVTSRILLGYVMVLSGTVGIFLSILNTTVKIPKFLVYLGQVSYGLYLFHMFWIWLLTEQERMPIFRYHPYRGYPLAFILTILSASLSYHFFERPILRFKARFETISTRPA